MSLVASRMREISVSRKSLVLPSLLQNGLPLSSTGFLASQSWSQRFDLRSSVAASASVRVSVDIRRQPQLLAPQ